MLEIFRRCGEDEFVVKLAIVTQHKLDLLALLHLDFRRHEHHLAVHLAHRYLNDPGGLLRVTGFARRKSFAVTVTCRSRSRPGRR